MGHQGGAQATLFTVRIQLDEPLLSGFHRRGRRKLREIEEGIPGASVKFVKTHPAHLLVSGTMEAIQNVRFRVECMTGPRKVLSRAAWSELMRTRTEHHEGALVAQIQAASECRLHIERTQLEVRLFGPDKAVNQADKMVDKLEDLVSEEMVDAGNSPYYDQEKIVAMGKDLQVTILISPQQELCISGLKALVGLAKEMAENHVKHNKDPEPDTAEAETMVRQLVQCCCDAGLEEGVPLQPRAQPPILPARGEASKVRARRAPEAKRAPPVGFPNPTIHPDADSLAFGAYGNYYASRAPSAPSVSDASLQQLLGEVMLAQMSMAAPAPVSPPMPSFASLPSAISTIGETALQIQELQLQMQRVKMLEDQLLQQTMAIQSRPDWMPPEAQGYPWGAR